MTLLLISFLLMIIVLFIAKKKNFFVLPKKEKIYISLIFVILNFLVYYFFQLFYGILASWIFKTGKVQLFTFVTLLSSISILCFLLLTTRKTGIWQGFFHSIRKNIGFGFLSILISLPIIFFSSSFWELLKNTIFNLKGFPDQIIVQYLKIISLYPFYFFISILVVIILVPIVEEILFRGLLQNYLKYRFSRKLAIIFTSIIFGIFHFSFSQKLSNLSILSGIIILGFFLSFIYERQKSLLAPIVAHSIFNALNIINLLLSKL